MPNRSRFRPTTALVAAVCVLGSARVASAQVLPSSGAVSAGSGGDIGASGSGATRNAYVDEGLVGTPRDLRTVPRAPTLPDLTHGAAEVSFEHTIASVKPPGRADYLTSQLFHFDFELPIAKPLYVGAEWGFAGARIPSDATSNVRFVAGQPQFFARAVYIGPKDLYDLGAGLGVIVPVVNYDSLERSEVTAHPAVAGGSTPVGVIPSLIGIVRPWDLSTFLDRRVTMRPFVDLRVMGRKWVVQFRQNLDVAIRSGQPSEASIATKPGDLDLSSISTLYLAYQPSHELAIGVEAWEIYLLKTSIALKDRDRSAFALSPSIRWYFRWLEPAVSVLVPVGPPLLNALDSYVALRIDVRMWFGGR